MLSFDVMTHLRKIVMFAVDDQGTLLNGFDLLADVELKDNLDSFQHRVMVRVGCLWWSRGGLHSTSAVDIDPVPDMYVESYL